MASRIEFSTNGTAHERRSSKPATKPARPTKGERDAIRHAANIRRNLAYAVGGVGVSVLSLSVVHCTESIALLTGSHWTLSGLLAVGIDAGMVLAELAELVAESKPLRRWSRAYIGLAVGLSCLLNAYAFSRHATVPMAGAALGLILPGLVLILGRIAGHLAK